MIRELVAEREMMVSTHSRPPKERKSFSMLHLPGHDARGTMPSWYGAPAGLARGRHTRMGGISPCWRCGCGRRRRSSTS
jgi:hypothetical protein